MKRLLCLIPFFLFANEAVPMMPPMPPALPGMNMNKSANQKNHKEIKANMKHKKTKNVMPKECAVIPPMLIFMPPPLQDALTKCKNRLFLPKLNVAKKVFAKKGLKVKSVSIAKGFTQLYKVSTNKGEFYCNKTLNKCFKAAK